MLNKKSSSQSPAWKISLVMPLILSFMLLFNVKTEAQVVEKEVFRNSDKQEAPQPQQETKIVEEVEIIEAPGEVEIEVEEDPEITWTTKTKTTTQRRKKDLGIDPLYVLNGKRYKASKLKNKYISLGSEYKILTGEDATNTYGEDAEGGAIIIPDAEIIKNFDKVMEEIEGSNQFSGRYIMVDEHGKPNYVRLNSSTSAPKHQKVIFGRGRSSVRAFPKMGDYEIMHGDVSEGITGSGVYEFRTKDSGHNVRIRKISKDSNKVYFQTQNAEPIYVVDDEIKGNEFIVNSIQPEEIAAINVLKGDKAFEKYGNKGKNGVIEIHTKASGYKAPHKNPEVVVFGVNKNFSESEFESLKAAILESTGAKVQFSGIERNSNNAITKIKISVEKGNQKTSANWDDTEGIPKISIGFSEKKGIFIRTF